MPAEMLLQYWGYILAAIVLVTVAYWAWDEMEEADRAADTTRKVGSRASAAIGGFVGVVVAAILAIGNVIMQTGMELSELAMPLFDFVGANPEASGGLVVTVLGWLGIRGTIGISGIQFVGVALLIVGTAVAIAAWRAEKMEDGTSG